jgi:aromatic-L-amino-acid decarboxylase
MDAAALGFEPDREGMLDLARAISERVAQHISTLGARAASDTDGAEEAVRFLREPLPEAAIALEPLLEIFFERVVPKGYNTAGPGMLSYVNGGGIFHAALADLVASSVNPYVGYWHASPGCTQIENTVVRWFADLMGMPATAGGVLTSGGSTANFTALVTARTLRLGEDFTRGVMYASDQVHHSVTKSALLAGFPARNIRVIAADEHCRLRPEDLARAVVEDRARGLRPFFVTATAGTTNTGAVDDLNAIADIAERERLWMHVDAAYGGFFAMTRRGRERLTGIERADSITLDPHKSLFLPYGTGCILARRVDDLERAHAIHSNYLDEVVEGGVKDDATNPADLSLEQTRAFRGLRVWLPMKLLGAAEFRRCLDEKLDLARWAADELKRIEGVEVLAEPQLSIVAFRVAPRGQSNEELDRLNRRIIEAINRRRRVHLSATCVHGCYAIRICVLCFRAHRENIETCLEDLRESISSETLTRR